MFYLRDMRNGTSDSRRGLRDPRAPIAVSIVLSLLTATSDLPGQQTASGVQPVSGAASLRNSTSSQYLSLDHWAYGYVDLLVARGQLADLSPLLQPYRRIDIAAAILAAERKGLIGDEEKAWITALRVELEREFTLLNGSEPQEVSFRGQLAAGLKAVSHTHRDPLRPAGNESLFLTADLELHGDAPAVAGALRMRWDNHYLNDPQFPGGRVIEFRECDPVVAKCAYRVEEGYLELQLPYVRLFFGRMDRNWGLPGRDGMLLSPYSYSYDHIGYRFGSDRIALSGLYAPFNDFSGDTARYFASHRFDWRIRDNFVLAVGESVVFGGENRRIDFNLINPVGVWEISGGSEGTERNALGMAEIWWRPTPRLITYGALVVDNTTVGNDAAGLATGLNQYAAAIGVQLPMFRPALALRGDLTVVSSLAYRSRVDFFEYYTIENLGLAQDKTDAVVLSLRGDWFPRPGWILIPRLDLMWKGEDDIRQPFPEDAFVDRDRLLIGVIERTIRTSLGGRWHTPRGAVRWDVGLNFVDNDGNIARDVRVIGVASVEAQIRHSF